MTARPRHGVDVGGCGRRVCPACLESGHVGVVQSYLIEICLKFMVKDDNWWLLLIRGQF